MVGSVSPVNDVHQDATLLDHNAHQAHLRVEESKSNRNIVPITAFENCFVFVTFVLLGNSALAFCTFFFLLLGTLSSLVATPFSGSLLTTYSTCSFLFGFLLLFQHKWFTRVNLVLGSFGFSTLSIVFCSVIHFIHVRFMSSFIIHLVLGAVGGLTFVFQRELYLNAARLPRNYMGALSLGFGCSGLCGFVCWWIISECLLMPQDAQMLAIWIYAVIGVICCNMLGVLFWTFTLKINWVANTLCGDTPAKEKSSHTTSTTTKTLRNMDSKCSDAKGSMASLEQQNDNAEQPPSRLHLVRARFCMETYRGTRLQQTANVFVTLLVTFLVYPNTMPLGWKCSRTEHTLLMGLFLCGDFVGRYIPNLKHWYPPLVVKFKNVKYFCFSRTVFLPLIIWLQRRDYNKQFLLIVQLSPFVIQSIILILFALSNGWLCSLTNMYVLTDSEMSTNKELVLTLYLLFLLGGISLGTWCSPLIEWFFHN